VPKFYLKFWHARRRLRLPAGRQAQTASPKTYVAYAPCPTAGGHKSSASAKIFDFGEISPFTLSEWRTLKGKDVTDERKG